MEESTYPKLKADERFKLMLAAIAGGDREEARRLNDSCPRMSQEITDPAFDNRMLASRELVLTVVIDWLLAEKKLIQVETELAIYRHLHEQKNPEDYVFTVQQAKADLKACLAALETFASRIDVPLKTLAGAWFSLLWEWIERRRPTLEDVEADRKEVEERLTTICECWKRSTGENVSPMDIK